MSGWHDGGPPGSRPTLIKRRQPLPHPCCAGSRHRVLRVVGGDTRPSSSVVENEIGNVCASRLADRPHAEIFVLVSLSSSPGASCFPFLESLLPVSRIRRRRGGASPRAMLVVVPGARRLHGVVFGAVLNPSGRPLVALSWPDVF